MCVWVFQPRTMMRESNIEWPAGFFGKLHHSFNPGHTSWAYGHVKRRCWSSSSSDWHRLHRVSCYLNLLSLTFVGSLRCVQIHAINACRGMRDIVHNSFAHGTFGGFLFAIGNQDSLCMSYYPAKSTAKMYMHTWWNKFSSNTSWSLDWESSPTNFYFWATSHGPI